MPCGSAGKESACNVGDLSLIPELGRSSGEGKGYSLQYSCLGSPMDYIVHAWGRKESDRTEQLSLFKLPSVLKNKVLLMLKSTPSTANHV